jgi:hypothetical protein
MFFFSKAEFVVSPKLLFIFNKNISRKRNKFVLKDIGFQKLNYGFKPHQFILSTLKGTCTSTM